MLYLYVSIKYWQILSVMVIITPAGVVSFIIHPFSSSPIRCHHSLGKYAGRWWVCRTIHCPKTQLLFWQNRPRTWALRQDWRIPQTRLDDYMMNAITSFKSGKTTMAMRTLWCRSIRDAEEIKTASRIANHIKARRAFFFQVMSPPRCTSFLYGNLRLCTPYTPDV